MTDRVDHLVIGTGEVGSALWAVMDDRIPRVAARDVEPVDVHADTIHVAFPWSDGFDDCVRWYAAEHRADLVVVHSTVPVGTCDPHGWVHSPVRGRHPHLTRALTTFTKHFGGARAREASRPFRGYDVCRAMTHGRAAITEAGKLWELVQYGLAIQTQRAVYDWCEANGLDGDEVYREFAETYNAGYQALGESRFTRPIIEPMPGPIGGHCVRQGAALLDHPLAALVALDGVERSPLEPIE